MQVCNCYKVVEKERQVSDFELGYYLGKFGKQMPVDQRIFTVRIGYCKGTKDCEICQCGGDRLKCDFYEEERKKAIKELKNGQY